MHVPGTQVEASKTVKQAASSFGDDNMMTYAAALAYRAFFSLFPFVIFLLALLGWLNIPGFFDWILQQAQRVVPQQAMAPVQQVISQIRDQSSGGLITFGILLTLWSASAAVRSTMKALNEAYDVEEERAGWKRVLLSVVYTAGLAVLLIMAIGLMLIGPQVAQWVAGQIGLGDLVVTLWTWLRWPVAIVLLMGALSIVFYLLPNTDGHSFWSIMPGAILAVVTWIIASLAFGFYVRNFGSYSSTYGSLGAVIVLMLYFFISAAVMLFGAEINAALAKLQGQSEHTASREARQRDEQRRQSRAHGELQRG